MATKALIRSLNRASVGSTKVRPVEKVSGRLPEPSACERCGAVFTRRSWRAVRTMGPSFVQRAHWTTCRACQQVSNASGFGRIVIRGAFVPPHEDTIRRRIANVAARARFTQPERRVSVFERAGDGGLEVITTSQKLAHRIVRELTKTFRGRASYAWSDDGTLMATWGRDR